MGTPADRKPRLTLDLMRHDIAALLDEVPDSVSDDDDLLWLGLDSIGVMRLASQWREAGAEVTFAELVEWRTLSQWWALVSGRPAAISDPAGDGSGGGNDGGGSGPAGAAGHGPLPEVDESAPFDLAVMQHAYWVGRADGQVLGGVGAHFYNEFNGSGVDPDRLERAVRAITARHGMLRAAFGDDGRQRIRTDGAWPGLVVHDLRELPVVDAEERLLAVRDRLSHRRLRVERGEVFDVQLSLLPGGTTRMHVHIEMLAADAQSFRLLIGELAQCYDRPDERLPPIGLSYPRYLAAVADRRADERARDRAYWLRRLPTLPGGPQLPLAVEPERLSGHRVTRRYHWLKPDEWQLLSQRCREHGVTLSVTFLAAFTEVLAAWSATPHFLLNLPLYDRQPVHPDVSLLVGDFTTLLLLEVDAAADERSFVAGAQRLQERLRADAAHSAYSGVDVLRDLAHARSGWSAAPVVFTSALSLGDLFSADARRCFGTPGWTMSQTPQVWLDFQVTEREGGLFLNWDAAEELFSPGVLDAMFAAYLRLLGWLGAPETDWTHPPPEPLPAGPALARARANRTAGPLPQHTLHAPVLARASQQPEQPALLWGDGDCLSYGDLVDRALRLAGRLVEAGVTPGDPVAVRLPKGPDQVVAVLGVLAAGGGYVPVGVDQPAPRRDRILAAAGVRVAVAGPAADLPAELTVLTTDAGADSAPLARPVEVTPDALAYLLFTSGSTGEPKGVRVPHRAAVNTVDAIIDQYAIGRSDRVLAVSALDFDLSVFDIFALLAVGGAVVCVDEAQRRDAAAWARLVRRFGVTIWQSVPVLLDMLLTAAAEDPDPLGLRLALLGGDWVGLDLADRLAWHSPGARLVALGGTTETAIHSTYCEVAEVPPHWRSVPYGRPLANQRCRVVDQHGRDRPDWVPGELWIGGGSVAAGYQNDPERTARVFVEHQGTRWYRTGDQARYWPDGTVEFLGRADFQVKIRGHRIELGEVEVALQSHPGVRHAVVTTIGDPARQLAAAVVPAGADLDPGQLRGYLAGRLPADLVPERIAMLTELPLSVNAKVDRRAVNALLVAETGAEPTEPARGATEELVAGIWSRLLDGREVGRNQSFFAIGGDSLIATRMLARLRTAGVAGAELRRLFATPVLAEFAAGLRLGEAPSAAEPLWSDQEHRYEPFPPTDVQRAYWMGRTDDFALGSIGSHWYWEFDGTNVDLDRLEWAINRLIARHEMLRAVFDPDGRQRILPEVPRFPIGVRDAAGDGAAGLAALRASMSHRVPDPSRWPLIEVRAVRYAGERVRLAFSFDYIVLDALSIVTFFAELSTLYRDPAAELPPLGVSFRDYLRHAEPDDGTRVAAERYWSGRVDGLPPAPQLPLRVDPATVMAPRFVRREARLTAEQWRAITEQAARHGLTPATVLAAGYAEVLAAWSGRDDLTLNLTLFNRREVHPDIGRVLGDFTSLLLVAHHPEPGEDWLATARRFQQQVWTDLEHSAISAIWVLRELARRDQAPAAQMPVVFTSALGVASELVDLDFPFGDLTWGVSQTPQVWLDNQVMERGGELIVNWDAVEELFCEGVLDAMFNGYRQFLNWLAAGEWARPVPDLRPAAQAKVRAGVNATTGPRRSGPLHGGFFAHAAVEPDRPALLSGVDTQVSYGELAERALQVAARLAEHGVCPGEPVAVTAARGVDQVAAVLGVLAAGGTYVPVGVDQPLSRRARIYANAGVRTVLTGAAGSSTVDWPEGVRPLAVGGTAGGRLSTPVLVDPAAVAYVIYTSGSTGEPKGVEITHEAAVNTVDDINDRFGIGAADRVLAVSALDFDLSVYDIFGLLSAGGAVVLIDEDDRREARRWLDLARRHRVTVWNSVPALLDMLLVASDETPHEGLPEGLRLVLVSGDWVGLDLPGRLAAHRAGCRLVALGGATEASIWSNAYEVGEVPPGWRSVPYGFPLRNQAYRVVDGRGRDCPDWVPGELWIGGAGVARGYRGDAERTARQFVSYRGERWYRTGDSGRYWPDGTLEFLGRTDFQVKVRGHRIELGEIEAALVDDPRVARAAAVTVGDGPARQLVAAVVPVAGTDPAADPGELRSSLAGRLSSYMVPQRIVVLPSLPLTANGKVDRPELTRVVTATGDPDLADEPPRGALEPVLAQVWARLLGVDPVGRGQSFFALGGDSLLATRLVAEVRRRWGIELTLRQLFAGPTVAQLASLLAGAGGGDVDVEEGLI